MNSKALIVLSLLLIDVFLLEVVASVEDTKHGVGNKAEETKLSCKIGRCEHAGEIPSVEADKVIYEADQGGQAGEAGLDEDDFKYDKGERPLQRGGGDTERGGGGGDSSRGGGGGDSSRGGGRGDRSWGGRRGRGWGGRGGRRGRGGRGGWGGGV